MQIARYKSLNFVYIAIFFLILILAVSLRFYQFGAIPPGVNRDEAAIGYNAFSILNTGKDEYGRSFPISFESFGDWKLPTYIYLSIPLIKIFGLSDASVRLLSIIAGILTVIMTPLLTWLLFKNAKISLISMFMIAITPWHIHFSRIAYEANLAVCFMTIAATCFLKSITNLHKQWLLIIAAVFSGLTLYTYHGNHIFTTLIILSLTMIYFKQLRVNRYLIISSLIFISSAVIIFSVTLFGADRTKISGIGILGSPGIIYEKIEIPRNEHQNPNNFMVKLVHNKYTYVVESTINNYLAAFSPEFLFTRGGTNHAHNILGIGNLYYVDAVFLFIGIIMLVKNIRIRNNIFILSWFFISPIAASITKDAPHSARMFAIFPIISILSAYGIYTIITNKIMGSILKYLLILILSILLFFNFLKYLDLYFIHFPNQEGMNWGIGYRQIANLLQKPEYAGKQIIFNHPEYSPYIFMLFYTRYNPVMYQQNAKRFPPTADAFIHVKQYDRFKFMYNLNINEKQSHPVYINLNMLDHSQLDVNSKSKNIIIPNNQLFATISEL